MADPRLVVPIPIDAPFADRLIYGRSCRVHGFFVSETSGAANASFILRNGSSVSAPVAVPVTLTANESAREWWGETGVWFDDGVFLDSTSGAVNGALLVSEIPAEISATLNLFG